MKIKKILFILVLFLVFGEAFALINMSKECACAASADGKLRTAKGFVVKEIDGVTYIDGYLVVNKTYKLPQTYKPSNTHVEVGNQQSCKTCIIDEAWEMWTIMRSEAAALGLNLWVQSGYRSYERQEYLYNNYVARDGKTAADTYSARPGHSEHQSGYAFDLNTITDAFANTKEGKWVNDNAYKYGFVIRYPKGKESVTGYKYESWHLRYVGKDLAEKLYNNGDWISMEEYFGIDSQYKY
ncbi:MAG: M15 family metallopeptidase [Bacteroidales bacterium]|nr:M15 family metallopeptidase [Bacteroidales bacterium]